MPVLLDSHCIFYCSLFTIDRINKRASKWNSKYIGGCESANGWVRDRAREQVNSIHESYKAISSVNC